MKSRNFKISVIAAAIALLPAVGITAPVFDANSETTPGTTPAETLVNSPAPYVAPPNVYTPDSSIEKFGDVGKNAHTNLKLLAPSGVIPNTVSNIMQLSHPAPETGPIPATSFAEYPASLACLYGVGSPTQPAGYSPGCVPSYNPTHNASGGSRGIALVLAYDNPTAVADLTYFSTYFGLPAPRITVFKVTTASGGNCATVPYNSGWALESSLDTQWSHAMSPNATIYLVEACDNSYAQLKVAEGVAIKLLNLVGGGEVSNSWGGSEWSTESADFDSVFRSNWVSGKPITFFFSAGDGGAIPQFPSTSPWVVSVGGTTINRDPITQAFVSESCWSGSGGGTSVYETYSSTFGTGTGPWTNYQYPLFGQSSRQTPDISLVADPASGAWVYSNGLWYVVGGTSLSSPALAGIVNNSNNQLGIAPSAGGYYTNAENNLLYAQLLTFKDYKSNFYDVTTGTNGTGSLAGVGWDSCTGVGSPRGRIGK